MHRGWKKAITEYTDHLTATKADGIIYQVLTLSLLEVHAGTESPRTTTAAQVEDFVVTSLPSKTRKRARRVVESFFSNMRSRVTFS